MELPRFQKRCAVVCGAGPRARSITFHFATRFQEMVPHVAISDLTLEVANQNGKMCGLRPTGVIGGQNLLIVVLAYEAALAEQVRIPGTKVRVERRIRNGVQMIETWKCEIVSTFKRRGKKR